ncbi:MAG TPA: prephenate dehydrogenase/arogenate dehydrogenase family protein [Fimbriimonas sp.]
MTVGIVGLGLIGGSIGLALRDPQRRIVGLDLDKENERIALARGCVDRIVAIEEAAASDIVFVAAPPRATPSIVRRLLDLKHENTVLTDCASVKGEVLCALDDVLTKSSMFVGGHPMAGHEKSGPKYSSAWLFRNARWILTPDRRTQKAVVRRVEEVVKLMGAIPVRMDPATHDRHVAILSHVPHAAAAALVALGAELESWEAGAGSWRDLTRVGGVDPNLWTQIMLGNRAELAKALADLERHLADLRNALENGDEAKVREILEHAKITKGKHEA